MHNVVALRRAPLPPAFVRPQRHAIVVVLVDAGHVLRVRRAVARWVGCASVRVTPIARRPQSRIDLRCDADDAPAIVASLDGCVGRGEIGRLSHFVVKGAAPRA